MSNNHHESENASGHSQAIERLFAKYVDRLVKGETIDLEAIQLDHPEVGREVAQQLRMFQEMVPHDTPAEVIGNYKLLHQIGEGGFGVVFMAEQLRPVKRRVAFKIIKPGMDTRQVIARFEAERQALALMDHPNIAKVYDAGATESGRPFFVMELIRGVPITTFCDQQNVSTEERLRLFLDVCHAVQHAHQKGIVHRDLKPSNVMVTMHDDKAVPKVIDFGVAKATQQDLTDKTLYTRYDQFIGTPAYMSPEQAQMSGLDIDTRSDIYSLGVLLYELLTGTTPFDAKKLLKAGCDEIRRVIREEEPLKPSTRVSTLNDVELTELSKCRRLPPQKLQAELRGDLDWMVMKALEKNRTRRYETANAFALDVQRHLNDEAVSAAAPSAAYRFAKYARRHRVILGTVTAIATVLIVGVVVSSWLAIAANRARVQADEARTELGDQLELTKDAEQKAKNARDNAEEQEQLLAFQLAEERLQSNRPELGIAQLAQLVRANQQNHLGHVAAERLMSALCQREHQRQKIPPLRHQADGSVRGTFSDDGTMIATGSQDGTARVWSAVNGEALGQPIKSGGALEMLRFSPNGQWLATAGGLGPGYSGLSQVWDWDAGTARTQPLKHTAYVQFAVFSPNGKLVLTGSDDHTARVWDAETGVPVAPPLHHNSVDDGTFSPDSQRVATAGADKMVRIWDATTGIEVGKLYHEDAVWSVAYSPDGQRLVTGCADGTAQIWDASSGRKLGPPLQHEARVAFAEFDREGALVVTASWDRTARVWDGLTGLPITDPLVHDAEVASARFNADSSRIVTRSFSSAAQVWDVGSSQTVGPAFQNWHRVSFAKFSPDGKSILTGGNGTAHLWEARHGQPYSQIFRHRISAGWNYGGKLITAADFSPDGSRIVTAAVEGTARVWDARTSQSSFAIDDGEASSRVFLTCFSADGSLVVTTCDTGANVWDAETGKLICEPIRDERVDCAAFSPDGKRLVTATLNGSLRIWNSRSGKPLSDPIQLAKPVAAVCVSPIDGRLVAAACGDGTAFLWDTVSETQIGPLRGHTRRLSDCEFSPDGKRLITGSYDGTARVWDVETGRFLFSSQSHSRPVRDVEFSPDGNLFVTASLDGTAQLWNAASGDRHGLPLRHDNVVYKARFSPDGQRIATVSFDGSARLWDTKWGLPLSEPLRHDNRLGSAVFSPDGRQLLTTGNDATARLWMVPPAPSGSIPTWFPKWAEAVVGLRLGDNGTAIEVGWDKWNAARRMVESLPDGGYYRRAAKWFFADPAKRTISPFSQIDLEQYVGNRIREDTVASLREAVRVAPKNVTALGRLAYLLRRKDEGTSSLNHRRAKHYQRLAVRSLRPMIDRNPNDLKAWTTLLGLDPSRENCDAAWNAFRKVEKQQELDSFKLRDLERFAAKFYANGRREKALSIMITLTNVWSSKDATSPSVRRAMRRMAAYAVELGEWARAVEGVRKSIRDDEDKMQNTSGWATLAAVYLLAERWDDHQELCNQLFELYSNSNEPTALDRAAKACLLAPPEAEVPSEMIRKAVGMARRSITLDAPEYLQPWFHLGCGIAEFRAGEYDEALNFLQRPRVSLDSKRNVVSCAYQAMAYKKRGDDSDADACLKKAEELFLTVQGGNDDSSLHRIDIFTQMRLALNEANAIVGGDDPRDESPKSLTQRN